MDEKLIGMLVLALLAFPFVSADTIEPGERPIEIVNKITNIGEFPNHIFIKGLSTNAFRGPGLGMCSVEKIGEDGIISGSYKFCGISVYAVEKSKWNGEEAQKFGYDPGEDVTNEMYLEFLESMDAKEVITNIFSYEVVPESSPIKGKFNTYEVGLNKVLTVPSNINRNSDYAQLLIYLAISLLALMAIIFILVRGKK